ncbi:hypothetical protein GCM10025857_32290 [Alicyclobacillus contaminans]|uniref:type IV pilus modification PilV family protein n=1 Tax=Alicyclobacillus contaminans TaxID=392016 RepID=UPI0003FF3DCA|nr:prepilin-type N-terminal cleavage/methylation domain-containing protein [Alicyclobacillus contaminans]GMA51872.1 hypothetical protein GCM10025857_32290 [Alicyclobacillus contaminans]
MKRLHATRPDGMTLIEVLASVVILSMFLTGMLMLLNAMFVTSKLNAQQQDATTLAQNMMARMESEGAAAFLSDYQQQYGQTPEVETLHGVHYMVVPHQIQPTPSWAASSAVYVEVDVSWSTIQGGKTITKQIALKRLFDQ